jgi:hypothetical protein
VILAVLVGAVILVRRRPAADDNAFAGQAEALRRSVRPQATAAQPLTVIHYHGGTHLHLEAGADTAGIIRQALPRGDDARPGEG